MTSPTILRLRTDKRHLSYATERHGEFYICFADDNLAWTEEELDVYVSMWEEGRHHADMYQTLQRPDKEVDILSLSLAYDGKIKKRPGGVMGGCVI